MEIRKYEPGNEKEILVLFKFTFGKEMSLEYWKWRFEDNPAHSRPMIYLMWDKTILIGHYAVSPNKIVINDQEYFSALSMTTMTHPDYGGKGIFTMLAVELYKNENKDSSLEFVWGFPNHNSHRGFIKYLSWKNVAIIPSLSLNVSIFRFKDSGSFNEFKQINSLNELHIKVHERCQKEYSIRMAKNVEYFYWRYVNHPVNEYKIFANDHFSFFIAKLFVKPNNNEVDIVEWSVAQDFAETCTAINSLIGFFSTKRIQRINLWMPLDDQRLLDLEKLGFTNNTPITYLGYSQLNNEVDIVGKEWFFQMGDSDVY